MTAPKMRTSSLAAVLYAFLIVGFSDMVGFGTSYIQRDFGIGDTLSSLLPMMVFAWFLVLSIPIAMLMNRIGRKAVVQAGNLVTVVGLLIPLLRYDLGGCLAGFALIGIGNTALQVSLNPLVTTLVPASQATSSLTAGQLMRNIASVCSPFVAAFFASATGHWEYMFPAYAGLTLLSLVWLQRSVPSDRCGGESAPGLRQTMSVLADRTVLLSFLGIFCFIGCDVCINTLIPKLLIERCAESVESAGLGSSVYFVARIAGAFIGIPVLARLSDVKYMRGNILLTLCAAALLLPAASHTAIMTLAALLGFSLSCTFSTVYAVAMRHLPERSNEISGVMIMAICGGAVLPLLMNGLSDAVKSSAGGVAVVLLSVCYLLYYAFRINIHEK